MILHEILKYPALELVVGMELDQQVVRSSFKAFGTQPHWDDERVQWWFGDARRSLLMLPREYYGTFDLVFVDLTSSIQNDLKVMEELSIFDVALLLVAPNGVISKNEDDNTISGTAKTVHTAHLTYNGVPHICQQSITMGSNVVEFILRTPKDHGIETLFLKPAHDMELKPFSLWYNYETNSSNKHRR